MSSGDAANKRRGLLVTRGFKADNVPTYANDRAANRNSNSSLRLTRYTFDEHSFRCGGDVGVCCDVIDNKVSMNYIDCTLTVGCNQDVSFLEQCPNVVAGGMWDLQLR